LTQSHELQIILLLKLYLSEMNCLLSEADQAFLGMKIGITVVTQKNIDKISELMLRKRESL